MKTLTSNCSLLLSFHFLRKGQAAADADGCGSGSFCFSSPRLEPDGTWRGFRRAGFNQHGEDTCWSAICRLNLLSLQNGNNLWLILISLLCHPPVASHRLPAIGLETKSDSSHLRLSSGWSSFIPPPLLAGRKNGIFLRLS